MFRFAVRDNSTAIMAVVAILGFFAYWTDALLPFLSLMMSGIAVAYTFQVHYFIGLLTLVAALVVLAFVFVATTRVFITAACIQWFLVTYTQYNGWLCFWLLLISYRLLVVGLVAIPRSIPDFLVFYIVKVFRVRPEHRLGTGETSPPVSWSFMVWPSDPSLDWVTPWTQMCEMCFNPAAQALITTISMTMYTAKEVGKTVAFTFTDNHRWMPDWKRTKIEKRVAEINAQRRLETPSPELRRQYRDAERQGWERQVRRERQFERELESEREIVRRYGAYATAESIRYCRSLLITRARPFAYKSTACKTPDFRRQRREREERDRERAAEPAAHHQAHTKKLICSPQDIMPDEVYKNPDGTLKDPVTAQKNLDQWEAERASSRPEIPAIFLTAPTPQHQFLQQAAAPIEPSGKASVGPEASISLEQSPPAQISISVEVPTTEVSREPPVVSFPEASITSAPSVALAHIIPFAAVAPIIPIAPVAPVFPIFPAAPAQIIPEAHQMVGPVPIPIPAPAPFLGPSVIQPEFRFSIVSQEMEIETEDESMDLDLHPESELLDDLTYDLMDDSSDELDIEELTSSLRRLEITPEPEDGIIEMETSDGALAWISGKYVAAPLAALISPAASPPPPPPSSPPPPPPPPPFTNTTGQPDIHMFNTPPSSPEKQFKVEFAPSTAAPIIAQPAAPLVPLSGLFTPPPPPPPFQAPEESFTAADVPMTTSFTTDIPMATSFTTDIPMATSFTTDIPMATSFTANLPLNATFVADDPMNTSFTANVPINAGFTFTGPGLPTLSFPDAIPAPPTQPEPSSPQLPNAYDLADQELQRFLAEYNSLPASPAGSDSSGPLPLEAFGLSAEEIREILGDDERAHSVTSDSEGPLPLEAFGLSDEEIREILGEDEPAPEVAPVAPWHPDEQAEDGQSAANLNWNDDFGDIMAAAQAAVAELQRMAQQTTEPQIIEPQVTGAVEAQTIEAAEPQIIETTEPHMSAADIEDLDGVIFEDVLFDEARMRAHQEEREREQLERNMGGMPEEEEVLFDEARMHAHQEERERERLERKMNEMPEEEALFDEARMHAHQEERQREQLERNMDGMPEEHRRAMANLHAGNGIGHIPGPEPVYADDTTHSRADPNPRAGKRRAEETLEKDMDGTPEEHKRANLHTDDGIGHVPGPEPVYADDTAHSHADPNPRAGKRRAEETLEKDMDGTPEEHKRANLHTDDGIGHVPGPEPVYADDASLPRADPNPRSGKRRAEEVLEKDMDGMPGPEPVGADDETADPNPRASKRRPEARDV